MLRAGLSVITVLLFIAMGFLLYTGNYITDKKTETRETVAPPPAPAPAPVPTPVPLPAPAPVTPPPPVVQAPPPVAPSPKRKRTHVVQSGESLSSISRKYYGTPDYYVQLAEANHLKSRDRIRVGQVLVLPELPVKAAAAEETNAPAEASTTVKENAPAEADTAEPGNDHHASTQNQEFEPQQPTLNLRAPKK